MDNKSIQDSIAIVELSRKSAEALNNHFKTVFLNMLKNSQEEFAGLHTMYAGYEVVPNSDGFDEIAPTKVRVHYYYGTNKADFIVDISLPEQPYILKHEISVERKYNPKYGDDRQCKCGHAYYRHFDSYENNEAVGCKYCSCYEFVEDVTGPEDKEYIALIGLLFDNGIRWYVKKESKTLEELRAMASDNNLSLDVI